MKKSKMFRNGKQLDNKGFSLLELLIVMAIIVVVSVATTVSLSVISKGNAKKVNKNLYSTLSSLKTTTMSKTGDWYMEVKKSGNQYEINTYSVTEVKDADGKVTGTETTLEESYKCSSSRISIAYKTNLKSDDTDTIKIDDNNSIKISFSRSDGSCNKVESSDGTNLLDSTKYGNKGTFVISVSKNIYESTLWYKTGRVTTQN